MGNIVSWHKDFPERCLELIGQFEKTVRERDRLGTFALIIAPSLLIAPYERLQTSARRTNPQKDFERFKDAKEKFDKLMKAPFGKNPFGTRVDISLWKYGKVACNIADPVRWEDRSGRKCSEPEFWASMHQMETEKAWKYLRDALAHWNVVTSDCLFQQQGSMYYMAFYRSDNDGGPWDVIRTTERGFFNFIKEWATFLTKSPAREALESSEAA